MMATAMDRRTISSTVTSNLSFVREIQPSSGLRRTPAEVEQDVYSGRSAISVSDPSDERVDRLVDRVGLGQAGEHDGDCVLQVFCRCGIKRITLQGGSQRFQISGGHGHG